MPVRFVRTSKCNALLILVVLYADLAEIVSSTMGMANNKFPIVFLDTDKSELRAPPNNPKAPG